MKRTIIALTLIASAFTGLAHADRASSVSLRVTEVLLPVMNCAQRNGESQEQMGTDILAIRGDMEVAFGQLYDLGALAHERGVNFHARKASFISAMRTKIDSEEWAKPLNAAERTEVVRVFGKMVEDGFEGK
ncbi:hypothetical protein IAJ44_004275 [Salmonella enterica]|nr:hypothetical protein [Salmonella enterica]